MCCAQPCSSNKVSSPTAPFHSCVVVGVQSVKVDRLSSSQDARFARALRSLPAQVKSGLKIGRPRDAARGGLVTWDKALEARGRASGVADTALVCSAELIPAITSVVDSSIAVTPVLLSSSGSALPPSRRWFPVVFHSPRGSRR